MKQTQENNNKLNLLQETQYWVMEFLKTQLIYKAGHTPLDSSINANSEK